MRGGGTVGGVRTVTVCRWGMGVGRIILQTSVGVTSTFTDAGRSQTVRGTSERRLGVLQLTGSHLIIVINVKWDCVLITHTREPIIKVS